MEKVDDRPLAGWRYVAVTLVYAVLFFAFFHLARTFRQSFEGSLWYPAAGLRLALLFHFRSRIIPGLVIADVLAVWLFAQVHPESRYGDWRPLLLVGLTPVLYGLGVAAVRRLSGIDLALRRVRDVLWLTVCALFVPLLVAAAGRALNVALGLLPAGTYLSATLAFWIGDAIGALMLTPCLLLVVHGRRAPVAWAALSVDAAAVWTTFFLLHRLPVWLDSPDARVYWYLAFAPIIWISLRHGLVGAVAGSLAMTAGTAWMSLLPTHSIQFLELQVLVAFLAATALLMGATAGARRRAEEKLRAQNEDLNLVRRELEARNDELRRRNAEMERFVYSVSHDLKSPLITINGLLGLLERDLAREKAERLREDLRRVRGAATTMNDLLDGLLALSSAGLAAEALRPVALTEVAREAATRVERDLTERGVALEIDPDLPIVLGDPPRLLQVFQHLFDNAVKFLGDRGEPRIEVGRRHEGDEVVVYVRDNGVGIEERYRERIFGLFEQLRPEAGGTGIGLALVRRIVEEHGGRIWVEPGDGERGSTFCFTVPLP